MHQSKPRRKLRKELIEALDYLPKQELEWGKYEHCAIGSLLRLRTHEYRALSFNALLAGEIMQMNDLYPEESTEDRFIRMRKWAVDQLL